MGEGAFARGFRGLSGHELGLGAVVAQNAHPFRSDGCAVMDVRAAQDSGDLTALRLGELRKKHVDPAAEHCLAYTGRADLCQVNLTQLFNSEKRMQRISADQNTLGDYKKSREYHDKCLPRIEEEKKAKELKAAKEDEQRFEKKYQEW